MKKVYYLSSCSTCKRILQDWNLDSSFIFQDIKQDPVTKEQMEDLIHLAGSAESLFSRRALKYKSMGLAKKNLTENYIKQLIQDEYTFLKRPVLIIGKKIFIGSAKKNVELAKSALQEG
jgi:arsenate reductase (glutaredoxin)